MICIMVVGNYGPLCIHPAGAAATHGGTKARTEKKPQETKPMTEAGIPRAYTQIGPHDGTPSARNLKAFPFDAVDPMGGDHEFYAPGDAVDYVHGVDTFESLVAKVKAADDFDDEFDQPSQDARVHSIVGFWIVTDKVYDIADSVWPEDGCCNDSATYMCNAAAKRILKKSAVGILTAVQYITFHNS